MVQWCANTPAPPRTWNRGALQMWKAGIVPSYSLDLTSQTLDPSLTFSRGSTATYYNSSGILTSAAANVRRVDYNPSTLAINGTLLEPASTNIATHSATPATYLGNTSGVTVTTPGTLGPDNSTVAQLITDTATNIQHRIDLDNIAVSTNTNYVASIYVKDNGIGFIKMSLFGGTASANGYIDVNTVTGAVYNSGALTGITLNYANVQSLPNGWFRISVSVNTLTNVLLNFSVNSNYGNTDTTASDYYAYLGNGTAGYFCFGVQFEQQYAATSYIPTVASAATRAYDQLYNTNVSGWYNASQGTAFCEYILQTLPASGIFPYVFSIIPASGSANSIAAFLASNQLYGSIASGGTAQFSPSGIITAANTVNKFGISYSATGAAEAQNGANLKTGGAMTVPASITQMAFGQAVIGSGGAFNGWIKNFSYYNSQLTNAQLQSMSGSL